MENNKKNTYPVPVDDEVLRRRLSDQKISWLLKDQDHLEKANQDIVDEQALREKGTIAGDDRRYKFSSRPTEHEDPTDIALDLQRKAWQSGDQNEMAEANQRVQGADRGQDQTK